MTLAQSGASAAIAAANCAGEVPIGTMPRSPKRLRTSGSARIRAASRCSLAMMASGVPAGASSANQAMASKPGKARFDHGRQVEGRGRTRERSDRERAHLAFPRERERRGGTGEHHSQATGEQVRHHRGDAAVGDMLDVEAGHGLVHLAGEMLRGADAGGAEGELAGLRAGERGEFGHALCRDIIVDDQNVGGEAELRDRREILDRVERQLRVEARMDDERPGGTEQERVAVGRALGDALGRHVAARAGHVLDHNRLAPGFGKLVADHPRNDVGGTAGHEADQDAQRLVGIALLRKRVARRQQRRQRGRDTNGLHRCSPCRFDRSGRREERNGRAGGRTETSGRVVMRESLT
jgi:hypothetical protein